MWPLSVVERIFIGRSHVSKVAEARVDSINTYCQVSSVYEVQPHTQYRLYTRHVQGTWTKNTYSLDLKFVTLRLNLLQVPSWIAVIKI